MITTTSNTTKTYKVCNTLFYIDVVNNKDDGVFEAWIYNAGYGTKQLMFSVSKDGNFSDYDEFLKIVEVSIPGFVDSYKRNVING